MMSLHAIYGWPPLNQKSWLRYDSVQGFNALRYKYPCTERKVCIKIKALKGNAKCWSAKKFELKPSRTHLF